MDNKQKRRVILVTDGDRCAQETLEVAALNIGGRCISRSGGNPTPLTSSEIVKLVKEAKNDPVLIMVDDRGHTGIGEGEKAMLGIVKHPEIQVLGVVAVASNTSNIKGIRVDFSIDKNGNVVKKPVDKDGNISRKNLLFGDTLSIVNNLNVPIVVGVGDIGKMEGKDRSMVGAPIITKALREIIEFNRIN